MKKKASVFSLFVFSFFLTAFTPNNAQSELAHFRILVQVTDDGFNLVCETGCAWKELAFAIKPYNRQAIDQNGMTSLSEQKASTRDSAGGFVFTIEKTNEGFTCHGIKGTSWVTVSSACSIPGCKQYVGHDGTWERH